MSQQSATVKVAFKLMSMGDLVCPVEEGTEVKVLGKTGEQFRIQLPTGEICSVGKFRLQLSDAK